MKEKIIELLRKWKAEIKTEVEIGEIYLFGSLIYRNGVQFDTNKSDLDLILTYPENIDSAYKRRNWLVALKNSKKQLEKDLLLLLEKQDATEQIVSIVALSKTEFVFNIHKSGSRNFFSINDFLNIETGDIKKGSEIFEFEKYENELIIQVIEKVQKSRNLYLKNSANKEFDELGWSGEDILPKEFARECAKINSICEGEISNGDEFNISFGCDFIKQILKNIRNEESEYFELYTWIDDRNGGRSNSPEKNVLESKKHLLLQELLFDSALEQIEMEKQKAKQDDKFKSIKINQTYFDYLQQTDLLTKAHSQKEIILLEDIYVNPIFTKYDSAKENSTDESLNELIEKFEDTSKILIAGEGQSGKTTICKMLFLELHKNGLIPLIIQDKKNFYIGKLENKINNAFKEQYDSDFELSEFDSSIIVPIIDDFHFAKYKEKHVKFLSKYPSQILIVDDIFGLNLKEESIIESYSHFKIQEFSPSLRSELIKNWVLLSDTQTRSENEIYQELDSKTELVDKALGKVIGSGIMPSYPFFILTVISTYETFQKPLDQEITSQGYCYQALVYMYLRKEGVKNDEIDTYINFLTRLAKYQYEEQKRELNEFEFDNFLEKYTSKFNLPVSQDTLLQNLRKTNILSFDNLGNYSFSYPYLYYFFVAKHFGENLVKSKKEIDKILSNLHNDDNAYIAIFISHHSKDNYVLDEIIINAMTLFEKYKPATLDNEELAFFDEKVNEIAEAVLPQANISPEKRRSEMLKKEDEIERKLDQEKAEDELEDNELATEMRRSIKTVEVMGRIIKNRSGSLEKEKLESIFKEGMNVHLRILTSFIDLIRDEKSQEFIEELIANRLNLIIKDKENTPDKERLLKIAKNIFWNMNFGIIYSLNSKIIHSLGSNKLTDVIAKVCDNEGTPASFIVKHGILMWYNKNLQIDNISERIDNNGFSKTAKNIMIHKIVNHCQTHSLGFKEHQKIETKFKIPTKLLLKRK